MTDGETSAIYSVLRGLDGVDEKTLKRPEVAYLPSVLEDGELPECVLGSPPPNFVVATDRRIIHVQRAVFGNKIKKHATHSYHEISSIERSMGMCIIDTAEKKISINAPKDKTEAFIDFVNPKIAEYRGPEIVDAPISEPLPPEEIVTDSEDSAIYSVLQRLDGFNEKTLKRPEVAYLSTVLEDGELPARVLYSPSEFVVATDRRIIDVKTREHTSYPYREIAQVEYRSAARMQFLIIHATGDKIFNMPGTPEDKIFNMRDIPKDTIESFIAFVHPKIAGGPDGGTSAVYSVLRGMGVGAKTLKSPAVAYLPSVLEDGEMPECVLVDSVGEFVFATDRQIIHVSTSIRSKHALYPYHEISWIKQEDVFRERSVIIHAAEKKVTFHSAPKDKVEAFISFVSPKIAEHRDTKLVDLYDKMKENIPLNLLATEATSRLLSLLEEDSSILWEDEIPLRITSGSYDRRRDFSFLPKDPTELSSKEVSVILAATNKRIILVEKNFVKDFDYADTNSIEGYQGRFFGAITIYVAGNRQDVKHVPNDQAQLVAEFIRNKVNELREQSQSASTPAPTPASVADELLKFSELLEKGVISREEFDAQKAKLLGS